MDATFRRGQIDSLLDVEHLIGQVTEMLDALTALDRETSRDGRPCVEFTWEGSDEGDQVTGRGWAALAENGTLDGRICFHLGDDSGFHAVRVEPSATSTRSRPEVS